MHGPAPLPPLVVDVAARLLSEPQVLDAWARDTRHERLQAAYLALYARVVARAAALTQSLADEDADSPPRLVAAAETCADEARAITMELSRLKWLLMGRRTRLSIDGFHAYEAHREDEAREVEELERLMADLHTVLC